MHGAQKAVVDLGNDVNNIENKKWLDIVEWIEFKAQEAPSNHEIKDAHHASTLESLVDGEGSSDSDYQVLETSDGNLSLNGSIA